MAEILAKLPAHKRDGSIFVYDGVIWVYVGFLLGTIVMNCIVYCLVKAVLTRN